MTLSELNGYIVGALLAEVGQTEARAMARVIFEDALGLNMTTVLTNPDRAVEAETERKVREIVERVAKGEPLQYVLGTAAFHGLKLAVRPGVLIPRPETSGLVDIIVDRYGDKADLDVLDVCTGSGAIALALGRSLGFPRITAVDISPEALEVTRENCRTLKLDNVTAVRRDILEDGLPEGKFDIVVSNPPYVEENERPTIDRRVLDHEPHIALFVPDDDPVRFYRRIAADSANRLKEGGGLFFEINPRHAGDIADLLKQSGYVDIEVLRDFAGLNRYITAIRP